MRAQQSDQPFGAALDHPQNLLEPVCPTVVGIGNISPRFDGIEVPLQPDPLAWDTESNQAGDVGAVGGEVEVEVVDALSEELLCAVASGVVPGAGEHRGTPVIHPVTDVPAAQAEALDRHEVAQAGLGEPGLQDDVGRW